ncbi:hypothetical protein CYG68_06480 [Morganella morganii]|uniref:Uncharacterized protein n=1 Tax=Morganella morganii TaxID=582 RepID=A0A8I0Q0M5_MORMO|nr:hypothetical protein [Morganella morganii]MBE8612064.1 hypothetical protein [Morganella morganii]
MKNKEMTPEKIVEYLKDTGAPSFLLDVERLRTNYPPLTEDEKSEYMKHSIKNFRKIIAGEYLLSCFYRFGHGVNSTFAFRHKDVVMDLSERVIEQILINEIEQVILDESEDGVFALWRLYTGNELKEKEEGSTWMRDFIDSVLIDVAHRLTAASANQTIH